jgi:hypothetical protein
MSLFRYSDYTDESKKLGSRKRGSHGGIATSKKIKIPTNLKSPTHKCSHCSRTDAKKYQLTPKECRWLCPVCVIKNNNRNSKEKPNFVKASKLRGKLH